MTQVRDEIAQSLGKSQRFPGEAGQKPSGLSPRRKCRHTPRLALSLKALPALKFIWVRADAGWRWGKGVAGRLRAQAALHVGPGDEEGPDPTGIQLLSASPHGSFRECPLCLQGFVSGEQAVDRAPTDETVSPRGTF